jgi:hypothetical protein
MKLLELSISNIGPIRQLILKPRLNSDGRPIPIALVGKNGSGKSLTLGALLDAITELRRKAFREIPETDATSYIRISSKNYISESSRTFSKVNVKLGGKDCEAVFSEVVSILPFSDLEKASPEITAEIISKNPEFKDSGFFKNIDVSDNQLQGARELLFLYFPYFRYEPSAWMSDKVSIEFAKTPSHYGISRLNPIRVNIIQETRGWILNALLDREIYERKTIPLQVHENLIVQVLSEYSGPNSMLISLINELLYEMLNAKDPSVTSARLGISQRTNREIAVLQTKDGIEHVAAFDIDQLSSGELMTIGLATEIIRGHELVRGNIPNSLEEIEGIVLVDEIDLHLHLEYQKTVLPRILRRFPLVQFIMTTHSPLFICGMAETGELDVIDLPSGRQISPEEFGEFNLCYNFFVDANIRFKQGLDELRQRVAAHGKPLIITEGKTDWKHLSVALSLAKKNGRWTELDVEFLEYESELEMGDTKLAQMCEYCAGLPNSRDMIFIFDRDNASLVRKMSGDPEAFRSWGNRVYSLCLPIPRHREGYSNVSIELLYKDVDLRVSDPQTGKRLWFSNEVEITQRPYSGNKTYKVLEQPVQEEELDKKVFDQPADQLKDSSGQSVGLSKSAFVEVIISDISLSENFDRSAFDSLFEILCRIQASGNSCL